MQFGKIIFHPGGDTVTIDASDGNTSSSLVEKGLLLSGGQSGLLIIKTSTEAVIQITYPQSITLRQQHNGPDLVVDNIREYSEYGDSVIDHPGYEEEIRVNIGGKLIINSWATEGSYQGQGNIFIEVNYL